MSEIVENYGKTAVYDNLFGLYWILDYYEGWASLNLLLNPLLITGNELDVTFKFGKELDANSVLIPIFYLRDCVNCVNIDNFGGYISGKASILKTFYASFSFI